MIHLMPVKTQSDGFDSVCIYSNDSKSTNRIKIQDHIRIAREKAHQAIWVFPRGEIDARFTNLTKENYKFESTRRYHTAFVTLKEALLTVSALHLPDSYQMNNLNINRDYIMIFVWFAFFSYI